MDKNVNKQLTKRKFKRLLIVNEKKFSLPGGDESNYSNNKILFPFFRLKIKGVIHCMGLSQMAQW